METGIPELMEAFFEDAPRTVAPGNYYRPLSVYFPRGRLTGSHPTRPSVALHPFHVPDSKQRDGE